MRPQFRRLTRRSLLAGLGATAALVTLAACEPQVVEKVVTTIVEKPVALKWPGTPATMPILGGVPNAPPRATPVPPPAGATPPPAPKPPAPMVVPLYAYIDTVTAGPGESKFNVDANLSCVKTSLFSRGMHIVWRMEVVDTTSGKVLQGADVKDATLKLPHGEEFKFRFARHGATEEAPWFWTAVWDVPMDYPLGVIDYSVVIGTQDGKSITVKDPLIVSLPARGIETRLTIVP